MARTALSDSHLGDPVASLLSDNVSLLNAERETVSAKFRTHYGWVEIEKLGLGYRTIIAWIVEFASRAFSGLMESLAIHTNRYF